MYKYQIIIYWSDNDGSFVAEVPELGGLEALGPTYELALQAGQEAIGVWLEEADADGVPIPEPQGRVEVAPKTGRAARREERIDRRRRKREKARWQRRNPSQSD